MLDPFHDSQCFRIPKELTPAEKSTKIQIVIAGSRLNGDPPANRATAQQLLSD